MAGGKARKKKWNKGKLREKMNSKVLFDEDTWTRFQNEVPKMKLVTPSALVERLKINVSLARAACKLMAEVSQLAFYSIARGRSHHSSVNFLVRIYSSPFFLISYNVVQEGKLSVIESHSKQQIYTRATNA